VLRQAQHEEVLDVRAVPFILILSPSKAQDGPRTIRLRGEGGRKQGPLRPFGPLPPKGEDLGTVNLPPLGEVPAQRG